MALRIELEFESLPLWKGVQKGPEIVFAPPFILGWDERGFIRQYETEHVIEQVVQAYASDDYRFITPPPGSSTWANRLGKRNLDFIERAIGSLREKTVLEIGAGSLYLADQIIHEKGASKYVVMDPAIREESGNARIEVRREYFDQDTSPDGRFDLILSFSCLEHVPDPEAFLFAMQRILERSKGQALLFFPDTEHQFRQGDFNVILHEHLNYFTTDTAVRLFANCGLRVLTCDRQMDGLMFLLEADGHPQRIRPLPMDETLPLAALRFHQNLASIQSMISREIAAGKKIAFHGACNGLCNVLFLTGMQCEKNIWVFDGDETKAGAFLPPCPNAICHTRDPFYREFDKVYIAAMTFYDEIREFLISYHGLDPGYISPLYPMNR